ncbi:MAG TPA: indole-3-glycerol phosphate synthase TrpC [Candidatus Avamphibacillus intestinigallinarum]|nr:indole-3-glycerol phosphate synthase TrpC [Candidatus Avamphibacillus intestinigallinarum]
MSTILDKIIKQKEKEVATFKRGVTLPKRTIPIHSFVNTLNDTHMNIISEIKRASPSKGMINEHVNPVQQAEAYVTNGAQAISVLTDETFFKGSMDDLKAVAEHVDVPVLCKDFIIDPIQIDVAKAYGASMILLIVTALDLSTLQSLYTYAKEAGLEVLVEVHNEDEMKQAIKLDPTIIGINNRDLKTFAVDLKNTGRLANLVTNDETILISESGIQSREDVIEVESLGADAILIGETLMRADSLTEAFQRLQVPFTTQKGYHRYAR